jgi:hypothetical protein
MTSTAVQLTGKGRSVSVTDSTTRRTSSWTLRNVDQNVIDLCRAEARRRGVKFGAWVSDALARAASQATEPSAAFDVQPYLDAITVELRKIEGQIDQIAHDTRVTQRLVVSKE